MQKKKLENLNCLITGGSMGLGKAIALGFVEEGAKVSVCARGSEALIKGAWEENALHWIRADVSFETEALQMVSLAVSRGGSLDVLVCNAGIYGPIGLLDELDMDKWRECIEINLYGVVHTCRAAIPHMKRQGRGKIIVIAGGGATQPMPNFSAYAASKAAVVRFAETLAGELTLFHIDVNSIAPGALNTRFVDQVIEAGKEKAGEMAYDKARKQKKSGGDPVEKAVALAVFLASNESDGITGKLISAKWDNWDRMSKFRKREIMASDVYTLRRVREPDSWSMIEG